LLMKSETAFKVAAIGYYLSASAALPLWSLLRSSKVTDSQSPPRCGGLGAEPPILAAFLFNARLCLALCSRRINGDSESGGKAFPKRLESLGAKSPCQMATGHENRGAFPSANHQRHV
jgi:hypothetical protein